MEKLEFRKFGVAHQAAAHWLDGTKLDRHEYIFASAAAFPKWTFYEVEGMIRVGLNAVSLDVSSAVWKPIHLAEKLASC